MASLAGLTGSVAYVPAPAIGNVGANVPNNAPPTAASGFPAVVDGTPVRVVVYALAGAAGIVALRMAGFKFNVGVSA